jgi:AI-2E family transporter/Mandelate racemase / muconate lactonizing enzyme, N-terminal domain/Enolase C-terminal domain-like
MNDLRGGGPIERVKVSLFRVPTDRPESDGTLAWDHTLCVVAEVTGGGRRGLGYTYAPAAAAGLIRGTLASAVEGVDAFAVGAAYDRMVRAVRNAGAPGVASSAIAAVDTALWDLKARLLDLPLVRLLDPVREATPIHGSGGFTSCSIDELKEQLGGYRDEGIGMVKMKVGQEPAADVRRAEAAREAVGPGIRLLVDANPCPSRPHREEGPRGRGPRRHGPHPAALAAREVHLDGRRGCHDLGRSRSPGVRLALALAFLAATLTFIPYIGPVLALLPAALIRLLHGPAMAGYVVVLYLGIQLVESYAITPLIQRSAISLPSGLILVALVLMGALVGGLGLVLATPILAVLVVLAKRLYVAIGFAFHDVLQSHLAAIRAVRRSVSATAAFTPVIDAGDVQDDLPGLGRRDAVQERGERHLRPARVQRPDERHRQDMVADRDERRGERGDGRRVQADPLLLEPLRLLLGLLARRDVDRAPHDLLPLAAFVAKRRVPCLEDGGAGGRLSCLCVQSGKALCSGCIVRVSCPVL